MMRQTIAVLLIAIALASQKTFAQSVTFASGADVSWCTEMEADGKRFYNADGTETELMALLRQIGMNAVRLRVWVNPEKEYGAWSDKADVVAKARRAHAQGLAVMIDFHYSDRFADPSQQYKPAAWTGYSMDQLKQAVADHTADVLQALKDEGIEPQWVQVGNETRPGMIFDEGKLDWTKSGSAVWSGYVALSNAGYEAVKRVLPNTQVIVHIDRAAEDNVWFFRDFKQYGGKFDMIGLSHYPDWDTWSTDNSKAAANVTKLHTTFNVPVMIVETGFNSYDETRAANVMNDLFSRVKGLAGCVGVFYWEPEVYANWKPAVYSRWGWGAYGKGAFTAQGRPSAALAAFRDEAAAVDAPVTSAALSAPQIFLASGQAGDEHTKGLVIVRERDTTRKVVKR